VNSIQSLEKIRQFIEQDHRLHKITTLYNNKTDPNGYFKKVGIKVELDNCKEIILKEETKLELGGVNNDSFSLVCPFKESNLLNDGRITLIGSEITDLSKSSIDFGMIILIGYNEFSEHKSDDLRHFNFISDGIEGFMIRTIPRRFWCRISEEILERFSFEFLGNAIINLYHDKFKDFIKSIEIIFVCDAPDILEELKEISNEMREQLQTKWKKKIEEWKKRIDCDYDWECNECPYFYVCEDVREVLEERTKLKD
jgi:CO dehydrogenase/acetyl-CoA synthase beta subunit